MARWLNVDTLHIPERRIVFQVPRGQILQDEHLWDAMVEREPGPVEQLLRLLVLAVRPGLSCCTIDFIGYDQRTCCFEIGVSHPSLDPVPPGCNAPKEPLDLAAWIPGRTPPRVPPKVQ